MGSPSEVPQGSRPERRLGHCGGWDEVRNEAEGFDSRGRGVSIETEYDRKPGKLINQPECPGSDDWVV